MYKHRSNGRHFRRQSGVNDNLRLIPGSFSNSKNNFKPRESEEKLLERYKILAKEALSSGDKTLSENYLQHVDHFERIVSLKNSNQNENSSQVANVTKVQDKNLSSNSETNQDQISKDKK
jgi:hypothetical protein